MWWWPPSYKIVSLLFHNHNFALVVNHKVNMCYTDTWYVTLKGVMTHKLRRTTSNHSLTFAMDLAWTVLFTEEKLSLEQLSTWTSYWSPVTFPELQTHLPALTLNISWRPLEASKCRTVSQTAPLPLFSVTVNSTVSTQFSRPEKRKLASFSCSTSSSYVVCWVFSY